MNTEHVNTWKNVVMAFLRYLSDIRVKGRRKIMKNSDKVTCNSAAIGTENLPYEMLPLHQSFRPNKEGNRLLNEQINTLMKRFPLLTEVSFQNKEMGLLICDSAQCFLQNKPVPRRNITL
jgi:hypothetical protein